MRKLFNRKQIDNNEAICVLVTKGYYNPQTRLISNDSTTGSEERTIMQIIASANPQEDLTTDKGKDNFAKREVVKECHQFIDGIIKGETIDPPDSLVELLTGNEIDPPKTLLELLTGNKNEIDPPESILKLLFGNKTNTNNSIPSLNKKIESVVKNILSGCLTKEDEKIWAEKNNCNYLRMS
jgi:hypothetical protein